MLTTEEGDTSPDLPLNDSLVLKSIRSEEDARRVDSFNTSIHGDEIHLLTYNLVMHHPCTRPRDFLFVEDESTGKVVSSLCLIPWDWRYEDIPLKAGEMGIVGTHPDYRRRGLVRALTKHHKDLLLEGGYHLSQIQGIPYYYRQFGYEYTLPLEGGFSLELHQIPEDEFESYSVRRATREDIPRLMAFYDKAAMQLDLSACRDEDIWQYLMDYGIESETACEFYFVLGSDQQILGYWAIALNGFGTGLIVSETSRLGHEAGKAILPHLRRLAEEREKDYVRFKLAANNDLVQTASAYGMQDRGTYAWQIHLPDVAGLLSVISPVLEKRLLNTPFAGLSEPLVINTYKTAYLLQFNKGRFQGIEVLPEAEGLTINLPPNLLPMLIFGYRSLDEMRTFYPDASAWGKAKPLASILFPKMNSYIYTIY